MQCCPAVMLFFVMVQSVSVTGEAATPDLLAHGRISKHSISALRETSSAAQVPLWSAAVLGARKYLSSPGP